MPELGYHYFRCKAIDKVTTVDDINPALPIIRNMP